MIGIYKAGDTHARRSYKKHISTLKMRGTNMCIYISPAESRRTQMDSKKKTGYLMPFLVTVMLDTRMCNGSINLLLAIISMQSTFG